MVNNLFATLGGTLDVGSIPGWGGSPGRGSGNPLQYSCLGNPMDRGAWRATAHADAESEMTEHARVRTAIEVSYYSGFLPLYFLPQQDSLV